MFAVKKRWQTARLDLGAANKFQGIILNMFSPLPGGDPNGDTFQKTLFWLGVAFFAILGILVIYTLIAT
jgi:hypothetical protein